MRMGMGADGVDRGSRLIRIRSSLPDPNPKDKKSEEQKSQKLQKSEWTEKELDLLKKQMTKYNVAGDPNRWEKISNPFRGKHGLENVIRKVKSIQERKAMQDDPFEQFLKKRKPADPQSGEGNNVDMKNEN